MRDLRSSPQGLSGEASGGCCSTGPTSCAGAAGRSGRASWRRQLTHPLALLLWVAAALSFAVGSATVAIAVLLVIVLNAVFAFVQELQAERAVEALARLPAPAGARCCATAAPRRSRRASSCRATSCCSRRATGSPPTCGCCRGGARGGHVDAHRRVGAGAALGRPGRRRACRCSQARDLVFSGTSCTGGEARGGRVRDRHAHRAGPDRRALRARQGGAQPARAPGAPGRLADRARRGRDGGRLRPGRDLRRRAVAVGRASCSPSGCSPATSPRGCCR